MKIFFSRTLFFFFFLFSVCVMGIHFSRRRRSGLRGKLQAIGFGENERRFEGSAMEKKESKEK